MGDIVNLRRARKERARIQADEQAQINRVAFGRSKAERNMSEAERALAQRRIEGHKLEPSRDSRNADEP